MLCPRTYASPSLCPVREHIIIQQLDSVGEGGGSSDTKYFGYFPRFSL
jgi:hypothetical protein